MPTWYQQEPEDGHQEVESEVGPRRPDGSGHTYVSLDPSFRHSGAILEEEESRTQPPGALPSVVERGMHHGVSDDESVRVKAREMAKESRKKRRPRFAWGLGIVVAGCLVVAHTYGGQIVRVAESEELRLEGVPTKQQLAPQTRPPQGINRPVQATKVLPASLGFMKSKESNLTQDLKWEHEEVKELLNGASRSAKVILEENSSFPAWPTPVISSVEVGDQVMRVSGGDKVTVNGKNFGDEDAEIFANIGDTPAANTEWLSPTKLVLKTAPGVGADLDIRVQVKEPAFAASTGVGKAMFQYTAPFIYDVDPLTTGQAVQGPANITINAWGIGFWDTKPEAQINGQRCAKTTWIDNTTVICTTAPQSRINLQNPELKVAGQRSTCGILVPGVCAVSASHGSITSPNRVREQIQAIKARGGDWKTAEKILKQQQQVVGSGFTARNDAEHPCRSWTTCEVRTYIEAVTSAVLMMMGMGSFCFTIYVMRPLGHWVYKEYIEEHDEEEEEEDDEDKPMIMGFDSRLRSFPRAESYAMAVHLQ